MKIQNKPIVFDFDTAAEYDELAYKKGLRDIFSIALEIQNRLSGLEKKYGKSADKLTVEEQNDFRMPLNLAEIRLLAMATTSSDEKEVSRIMKKELDSRSVIEIGMDFVNGLMQSKVFVAAKVQAEDENPKQPK